MPTGLAPPGGEVQRSLSGAWARREEGARGRFFVPNSKFLCPKSEDFSSIICICFLVSHAENGQCITENHYLKTYNDGETVFFRSPRLTFSSRPGCLFEPPARPQRPPSPPVLLPSPLLSPVPDPPPTLQQPPPSLPAPPPPTLSRHCNERDVHAATFDLWITNVRCRLV